MNRGAKQSVIVATSAVLVAVAGIAGLGLSSDSPDPFATRTAAARPDMAASEAVRTVAGTRDTVAARRIVAGRGGRRVRYDASFETCMRAGSGTASASDQVLEAGAEVIGELDCTFVSRPTGRLECWSFATVTLGGSVPIGPEIAEPMRRGLSGEFVVERNLRGEIVAFRPVGRIGRRAHDTFRALLESTQLVGVAGGEDSWSTIESDRQGRYPVRYRRRRDGAGRLVIARHAEDYLAGEAPSAGAAPVGRVVAGGTASAVFDDLATPPLRLHAGRHAALLGKGVATRIQTRLLLERIGDDVAVDSLPAGLREALDGSALGPARDPDDPFAAERRAERRAERLRELADGVTVAGLCALLDQLAAQGALSSRAAADAVERLAALVELDPARAAELRDRMTGRPDEVALMLAGALGTAGTPAAQQALCDVALRTALPAQLRQTALASLAAAEAPTDAGITALRAILEDGADGALSGNALLVLGVAADRLRASSPARSAELVDVLLAQEGGCAADGRLAQFLDALGNVGVPRVVPVLDRYLLDGSSLLRSRAVLALGRQPVAVFAPRIVRALGDADAGVRLAALEVLGLHGVPAGCRDAVSRIALQDPDGDLRALAAPLL